MEGIDQSCEAWRIGPESCGFAIERPKDCALKMPRRSAQMRSGAALVSSRPFETQVWS